MESATLTMPKTRKQKEQSMATLDSLGMDFSTQPTCVSGVAPSRRYWAGLTAALRPSLSSVGSVRPMRSCPEPRATQRPKQARPPRDN